MSPTEGPVSGRAPAVSVVMCAFNEAASIGRAVESALRQTLTDLELIVVDDASTDGTSDAVRRFSDSRVRLVRNDANLGISRSRNAAISLARGRYIAILDADDIAHPGRLAAQASFLDARPEIALCGTWTRLLSNGRTVEFRQPVEPEAIRRVMLHGCPIFNSSLMARAAILREFPYDPAMPRAEDYDLFLRVARRHPIANIPEFLLDFETSLSWRYQLREQWWKTAARWRALTRYGYPLSQAHWLLAPLAVLLLPLPLKLRIRRLLSGGA